MSRRKRNSKGSWRDFILFLLIILCVYFILALFDSSLAGEGGREFGNYLRRAWGGALIVLLLFWLYLCIALLMDFRIPLLPRQVLGTVQLYISFSFMLGLLKESGWNSNAALFMPGAFGHGLAKFFVLNIGTFITLILVIGSFILSAYFYGSKILRVSLPELPSFNLMDIIRRQKRPRRIRRRRERDYPQDSPEHILFTRDINAPDSENETESMRTGDLSGDFYFDSIDIAKFKNASPENKESDTGHEAEPEKKSEPQNPVEVFDSLLAILDTAPVPEKKKPAKNIMPPRKIRRPLRNSSYESESSHENSQKDSIFPVPAEIFGPAQRLEIMNGTINLSDEQGRIIISTLKEFNVNAEIAKTVEGASVIQYQLELAPGTKISKASELDGELAMALAVMSVRIEAPIPGTPYVGIEVPRKERKIITFRSMIESDEFRNTNLRLPLALGVQNDGKVFVRGLDDMPHMIIAGSKGSGRSMFINTCILSMCSVRRPDELKLILIDPRHIEFSVYDSLPHLLSSPVSESEDALKALYWAAKEMETRTKKFADTKARNLAAYNRRLPKDKRLPEIVIVIDEFNDMLYESDGDIEGLITGLVQKAGSCGIHVMIAAERNISRFLKANIPVCAAFALSSREYSHDILGVNDAFRLTGKGDMLFKDSGSSMLTRLQAPYITEERISDFVDYMNSSLGKTKSIKFD
ncbi:MAG: DNA translocase FtsK [Synergistaceae bacterium]|nr:DNA translocase FtsK [Synergistaceae bacterium]